MQPIVQGTDDHLIEFSEALRTVAKALRQVAEGKASAQIEAAEWKRKYELERARNRQLENKVQHPVLSNEAGEQSERCCGENGICSHEVLRDGHSFNAGNSKLSKKASFKLSWFCKGENSDQHKHDIVSFEKGNITTAERSSKQISLKWESPPQTVLIMSKPDSTTVRILCADMVR